MYGPSDAYGDLTLEDVEEFEGLQPDDEQEIEPLSHFQRNEVRNFIEDFEYELDQAIEDEYSVYEDDEEEEYYEEEGSL